MMVFGIVCYYFYQSVLDDITPLLPENSRNNIYTRFVVEKYVWNDNIPKNIKNKYIAYEVAGTGIIICMSIMILSIGKALLGFNFAVLACASMVRTVAHVIKCWDILRG